MSDDDPGLDPGSFAEIRDAHIVIEPTVRPAPDLSSADLGSAS